MTTDSYELPELPEAPFFDFDDDGVQHLTYTTDQMREYALLAVKAERERCARVCEDAKATRVESAAQNNGRASDFAFGYVNAAEEIAAAIRNV